MVKAKVRYVFTETKVIAMSMRRFATTAASARWQTSPLHDSFDEFRTMKCLLKLNYMRAIHENVSTYTVSSAKQCAH